MATAKKPQTIETYLEDLGELGEIHKERFYLAFNNALTQFNDEQAKCMRLYNGREKANCMHAYLRHHLKKVFRGVKGVYFDERPNRAFKIILDGRPYNLQAVAFVKIKKSAKNLRTANIKTKTVVDFMTQQMDKLDFMPIIQHSLFENVPELKQATVVNIPDFVNLIASYCPNKIWSDFERLAVSFPISIEKIKLVNDFTDVITETNAEVVDMKPQTTAQTEQRKRVRQRQNIQQPTRKKLRKIVESREKEVATNKKENIKKKA